MPTIIALDISLSMTRFVPGASNQDSLTYHQLAVQGINQFLNYLSKNSKLEYISLVSKVLHKYLVEMKLKRLTNEDKFRMSFEPLPSLVSFI